MAWAPPESDRLAVSRQPPVGGGWTPPQNDVMSVVVPKPAPRIPSWQEAIFPNRTAAGGDIAPLGLTALGASAKDLAALPVNVLSGLYAAIGAPSGMASKEARTAMASKGEGDMDQTQRAIFGLGMAGGPIGGAILRGIPAATAIGEGGGALANFGRIAGAAGKNIGRQALAGAAESAPAAAFQASQGDIGGAAGSLGIGALLRPVAAGLSRAPGAVADMTERGAGTLSGVPGHELAAIGPFGMSDYGRTVSKIAKNPNAAHDLGQVVVDRVKNFDQYLPNAAAVDKMVANLPPIDANQIISALERSRPKLMVGASAKSASTKIDELISDVSKLTAQDGTVPASLARQIKQTFDAEVGDAFGKESSAYISALKNGRHDIAKALESAAERSGVPEYKQAMQDYTRRLGALDKVTARLGGDEATMRGRVESYISNLGGANKTEARKAFAELADIMGEDFAAQAQAIATAKKAMPQGSLPIFPTHTTGRSILGLNAAIAAASGGGSALAAIPLATLSSPLLASGAIAGTHGLASLAGTKPATYAGLAGLAALRAKLQAENAGNR